MKISFGQAGARSDRPEFVQSLAGAKYFVALVAFVAAVCPNIAGGFALAQTPVNVLTAHNDNTRQGQNINEIYLTPRECQHDQLWKAFFSTDERRNFRTATLHAGRNDRR